MGLRVDAPATHTCHKNKQLLQVPERIKMQAFEVGAVSMPRMVCSFRRTQEVMGRCARTSTVPAMASLESPHLNCVGSVSSLVTAAGVGVANPVSWNNMWMGGEK